MTSAIALRTLLLVSAFAGYFLVQRLLARKRPDTGAVRDHLHELFTPWLEWIERDPRRGDRLLIASSLLIDATVLFLIACILLTSGLRVLAALSGLFALRALCQAACDLPPPQRMFWRNPGVPSLFVTYGTHHDFYFSGHIAVSVFGAAQLAVLLGPWGWVAGAGVTTAQALSMLTMRQHYTMDVVAGALAGIAAAAVGGML
jgi:hypothetical protein